MRKGGSDMDVMDLMIMASMAVLAAFFAGVAVLDWRDARAERRNAPDAQVIQHPGRDRRASAA